MKSRSRLAAALAVAVVLTGACSSDDKDGTQAQGGKTAEPEATTKEAFIKMADALCATNNETLDELMTPLFTGEELDPDEVKQTLNEVLDRQEELGQSLRDLEVPKGEEARIHALLDEAEKAIARVRTEVATPDGAMAVLNADEDPFAALDAQWAEYGFVDCAGEGEEEPETGTFGGDELSAEERSAATKVEVKGFEYGYDGMPAKLAAGPAVFSFTNSGEEFHEIGMVRLKDGVTPADAFAKLAENPDDESFIDRMIGAALALPDESSDLTVKLAPGTYAYACIIPDANGVPHAAQGMNGSFIVE